MLTTVNVLCEVKDQNGHPVVGGTVSAILSGPDIDASEGYVLPELVSGVTDVNGLVTLALWPNQLGSTQTIYNFKVTNPDTGKTVRLQATIPNANCSLHLVANLPPYQGKPDGQLAVDTAIAAAGTATTQAGIATAQAVIATAQATAAAAAYDAFDDRYLGAKTSDPTLDNDGNALLTGALYFNTSANEMRVYTGTAWIPSAAVNQPAVEIFVAGVNFTPGASNSLTLARAYGSISNITVHFDSAFQGPDQIASIVGNTLTFNAVIPVGVGNVYVKGGTVQSVGVPADGSVNKAKLAPDALAYISDSASANLAASGGAALVGNGAETVADSFNALQLADYAALRASTSPRKSVYVTGYLVSSSPSGIAGMFVRDDSDSSDNGGTSIVRADGKRYKRQFSGAMLSNWFGTKGDGVVNDTASLLSFLSTAIASGRRSHISAGTYLINEGTLAFDTPFVDAVFPIITTDGHEAVFFKAANFADAPLLAFSNGTATSGAGRYWLGGELGGITFMGGTTGTNSHGLSLRGMWATKFGWMRGNDLKGDLINVPNKLYGGTNPDPYAVSFASFHGIEANRCTGFAINNRNYLGMDSWEIRALRAINCVSGVWYGMGSGCRIHEFSVGSCGGWAMDDGTNIDAAGGAPSRVYVGFAEFDDVQYGIRLNRLTFFDFVGIRFIHRFNFSSLNPSGGYWPRVVMDIAGGASPQVYAGKIQCVHRIEAGGTKSAMGVFLNGNNNPNITNLHVSQKVIDNAGFGFANTELYTGMNVNASFLLDNNGRTIFDLRDKALSDGRGSASTTVPNSGFGAIGGKIAFPTQVFSTQSVNYDTSTSIFTAPSRGLYEVDACIPLVLVAGTRVRMGVVTTGGGLECPVYQYAATANVQHYGYRAVVLLNAGDTMYLTADQNTASATVSANPQTNNNEVRFTVKML